MPPDELAWARDIQRLAHAQLLAAVVPIPTEAAIVLDTPQGAAIPIDTS
jgi:hypothetical protein